jgi:hypothetical protein
VRTNNFLNTRSVTSWRSLAVVERTGLAVLLVGAATLLPAFAVVIAVDSSLRDRAKWSSMGPPDAYPGGSVDFLSVATTVCTVVVAMVGATLFIRHLVRRGVSKRAALLAAAVALVLVLLTDAGLILAALRSAS